ncbi:hypothetical protein HDU67_005205, partial [Dinochytrium kinnereticum]
MPMSENGIAQRVIRGGIVRDQRQGDDSDPGTDREGVVDVRGRLRDEEGDQGEESGSGDDDRDDRITEGVDWAWSEGGHSTWRKVITTGNLVIRAGSWNVQGNLEEKWAAAEEVARRFQLDLMAFQETTIRPKQWAQMLRGRGNRWTVVASQPARSIASG